MSEQETAELFETRIARLEVQVENLFRGAMPEPKPAQEELRGKVDGIRLGWEPVPGAGLSPSLDPWRHRSKGMKCATCMWYVVKAVEEGALGSEMGAALCRLGQIGRCRRRAPTLDGYPSVYPADWCGSHKLDENKV